jgi:hypothetical protein
LLGERDANLNLEVRQALLSPSRQTNSANSYHASHRWLRRIERRLVFAIQHAYEGPRFADGDPIAMRK